MSTETGGPAFPATEANGLNSPAWGMTLRDYFAAQALAGIEASQGNDGNFISKVELVALRSYELADAMIRARESA